MDELEEKELPCSQLLQPATYQSNLILYKVAVDELALDNEYQLQLHFLSISEQHYLDQKYGLYIGEIHGRNYLEPWVLLSPLIFDKFSVKYAAFARLIEFHSLSFFSCTNPIAAARSVNRML